MDNLNAIAGTRQSNYEKSSMIVLLAVSVLICTFLRVSLLLTYPFVILFIGVFYKLRLSNTFFTLVLLVALSFAASFFGHAFLKYKLLSLFYMLPFLFLLFANPVAEKTREINHLATFMKAITIIAVINNLIGFVQLAINPKSDDSFLGIYSQYSIAVNGLMLINTILFFYYMAKFAYNRQPVHLAVSLFFLACSMLGFYGAGLVVCLIAFIFAFLQSNERAIIKTILISVVSLASVYFALLVAKPLVLEYNLANMKKISSFDVDNGPRKLKSFYNYAISYPRNAKDFLLGSGPGTFNSRTAFLVGSPSYFTAFSVVKDDDQPYYFKHYAYPLWNESNTIQSLYLDGFRNQPFSSVLSFLGEYGALFFSAFSFLYWYYFVSVSRLYRLVRQDKDAQTSFRFFKFLMILLPLLLLIDNYYEYPEVMLLLLLGIKFSHANLITIKQFSRDGLS